MTTLNEQLTIDIHISAADTVAQLSQATGLSDEQLLEKMPELKSHKGVVILSKFGNEQAVEVILVNGDDAYLVELTDDGVKIKTLQESDYPAEDHEGQWNRHWTGNVAD